MIVFFLICMALADEQFLRIAVSDTEQKSLQNPMLLLNNIEIPFFDDGLVAGDVASDNIWVATSFVERGKELQLAIKDGGRIVRSISFPVTNSKSDTLQLKNTQNSLIVDIHAPTMPGEDNSTLSLGAEALAGVPSSVDGQVRLRIIFNDQPTKRTLVPTVRWGKNKISLVDDGKDPSDTALDNVWLGWIDVPRQEKVELIFEDGTSGLGFVEVSLPATPAATLSLYRLPTGLSRFSAQLRAIDKTVVQATAQIGIAPLSNAGVPQINLNMMIDMRGVEKIENPSIRYSGEEVFLSDDGTQQGDTPNDEIYFGSLHVDQQNTADISLYNGGEKIGSSTVFLPESGHALVKLQVNNGLGAWVEQGKSDIPLVAFTLPQKKSRTLGAKDTEQEIAIILSGDIPTESEIRISAQEKVLGMFSVSTKNRQVDVRLPIYSQLRAAIVVKGEEKDVFWLIPANADKSIVALEYAQDSLSLQEEFIVAGEIFVQSAPLVLQAVPKSDEIFTGKTLLSIHLSDPLQQLVKPELSGYTILEKSTGGGFEGTILLEYTPFVVLEMKEEARILSTLVIFIPKSANASLGLSNSRVGIQASDTSVGVAEEPLIFEAAKEGKEGLTDKITVQILVDDRVLQRLRSPVIRLAQAGQEEIILRDDGEDADQQAMDQVYTASFLVSRAEYLQIAVEDKGKPFGEMTVFLPSSSEAKIRLRTVDAKNGLKLLTEAQALSEVDSPSLGVTAQEGGGSERKLVHILWVSIILFALFFAYVRSVIYQSWTSDIQPILRRLEKFLEENDKEDSSKEE